jgi:hypothetical protein
MSGELNGITIPDRVQGSNGVEVKECHENDENLSEQNVNISSFCSRWPLHHIDYSLQTKI